MTRAMRSTLPVVALLWAGCISAGEIVVVDRATALELQAAASFEEVEQRLARAALAPQPVPLTPDQLQALGMRGPPLVDRAEQTDADQVDELLRQRCLGEALDGRLLDTFDACIGAADRAAAEVLAARVNAARVQLWHWLRERGGGSPEEVRRAWRQHHLEGVVCGGWVQQADGKWEAKKC